MSHTFTPPAARAAYAENGFHLAPACGLPADAIARAVTGMDAVRAGRYDTGVPPEPSSWKPGDDPRRLCKIEMPQVANRAIYDLLLHPALGQLAAALTGARLVQVWWVQLLYKPAGDAGQAIHTNIGWHQDRTYWQEWEDDSQLFTAWIALSDVTADAGPMRFVRGSHRWGTLKESDFMAQDHAAQLAQMNLPAGARWEEVPAILPPGGVSVHNDLTIHGSGPNLSQGPRRSVAVHLRTENAHPRDAAKVNPEAFNKTIFLEDPRYCPVIYRAD
ncbi:MAG: phytanoyl-CoA dioxygenase family protein [Lentisphaerae bacterium]|nr:phytanoyl-CoA dioxygenase family protein [Lentisphaerota bacterium]